MLGPEERILHGLGVSPPRSPRLQNGLDEASGQLLGEAGNDTAAQRWHAAAMRLTASRDIGQMANHVLARDTSHATLVRALHAPSIQDRRSKDQQDSMQTEPLMTAIRSTTGCLGKSCRCSQG